MTDWGRNDPCWCGSGKKYKKCHYDFDRKLEELKDAGEEVPSYDIIKTEDEIKMIRKSAKVNIAVLDYVSEHIHEGVTTAEIDNWVYDVTTKAGAIPAPLGYEGFPKSVCTSINDQVCHGIPADDVVLKNGDIINVDVSTILDGYYSDSSRMFCIGDVKPEWRKLVEDTKKSVEIGLEQVKPWGHIGDISQAVRDFVQSQGYSVVREIGGHGCGLEFHEDPWVGFVANKGTEMIMAPGMIFTIEPMVNLGRCEIYTDKQNGWTVYTRDGQPSAQWEIQVLVTEDGYEVISY